MATIEELREQENQPSNTFILGGGPAVMTVFNPSEDDSPDTVLFRLTNCRSIDVLWVTADGQLHFGPQALAGLTRHVLAELTKLILELSPEQRIEASHKLNAAAAQQTGRASWNCRRCNRATMGDYGIERERCLTQLCKACWLELEEDKGIYRTEIPAEQLQGEGGRLIGPPAPELYGLCPVCGQAADHLHPLMGDTKPAIVSSEKLAELAEKYKPPQSWYEETGVPVGAAGEQAWPSPYWHKCPTCKQLWYDNREDLRDTFKGVRELLCPSDKCALANKISQEARPNPFQKYRELT